LGSDELQESRGGSSPPGNAREPSAPSSPASGARPSWTREAWSTDISGAPVDSRSRDFINFLNTTSNNRLHPAFGGDLRPGSHEIWGMPYVIVGRDQPKKVVRFVEFGSQSDGVNHETGESFPFYPIPDEAIWSPRLIQNGSPGNVDMRWEDRHLIIVDQDHSHLYELYHVYFNQAVGQWEAGSGAFFDMNSPARRPEGWTSADASGLPIFPGLLRYDEVYGPAEIDHALRVTVRATNRYAYPASHEVATTAGALPLGARLRLKASTDISRYPAEVQKIFRAMKKYGLLVADNGGDDIYVTGTYDLRWDNDLFNPAFHKLTVSDFEVIQLGYRP
jgi:hypothetical protein